MPLKSQLCDRNGNVIEQILFAEINLRDRIPAESIKAVRQRAKDFAGCVRIDATRRSASIAWRLERDTPAAGFRLTTWRLQIIAGSNAPVRHLVYSDGLASVSVFIEPRDPQAEPMNGLAKVGAAFVFSRESR